MGSGGSHKEYFAGVKSLADLSSPDESLRRVAFSDRTKRVMTSRLTLGEEKVLPKRATEEMYDEGSVRKGITKPANGVERARIILIDNSGSNRAVANKLRQDSGYLTAFLKSLDPESQIAFIYFSDHCDGDGIRQDIDFVYPNEEGDKIICSTLRHIYGASGGDAPEAIECMLWDACDIDFNDAKERHLILITDVVAHGMGLEGDDGCPLQRDWRQSLEKVKETFTSFVVVGSGDSEKVGELQKQFISADRVGFDLIDLSSIKNPELRLGMSANAILFLIARQRGKQAMELFLSALYEKWLAEPLFGLDSDEKAKEMIQRLGNFLEYPQEEVHVLLKKVLLEE